jgi:3-oxoacyl-(acyl-carrier-protein) synthase
MGLENRVVVTGMGVCTPLGRNVTDLWDELLLNNTSITDVRGRHPTLTDQGYKVQIGSDFLDFQLDTEKIHMKGNGESQFGISLKNILL